MNLNNYIMMTFRREMDSFPVEYRIGVKDDKYYLYYRNLPTELDYLLIKAEYDEYLILSITKTMFGDIKQSDRVYHKICKPFQKDQNRILCVDLNDEFYITKLNKLSSIIRNYYSK